MAAATLVVIIHLNYLDTWGELARPVISAILFEQRGDEEAFLGGGCSRVAGVLYYLNQPLKVLGEVPSRYYDLVRRVYILGNTGQVITFYAEMGIIGLLMGYWILWTIARTKRGATRTVATLLFCSLAALTITTSVMSDASIMLAYNLFLSTALVRRRLQ